MGTRVACGAPHDAAEVFRSSEADAATERPTLSRPQGRPMPITRVPSARGRRRRAPRAARVLDGGHLNVLRARPYCSCSYDRHEGASPSVSR